MKPASVTSGETGEKKKKRERDTLILCLANPGRRKMGTIPLMESSVRIRISEVRRKPASLVLYPSRNTPSWAQGLWWLHQVVEHNRVRLAL